MSRAVVLTTVLCLAQVLAMVDAFAFPALLPTFFSEWGLTNTEAGWIAGAYFGGYTVAVPVLVSLTDRVDARLVYLAGAGVIAVGASGIAVLAEGFWTALFLRGLAGVGLAGTYMPGLRALTDRCEGSHLPRTVAFYTASFGLGTALSFLAAGAVEQAFGWRWVFAVATAVLALVIVALALRPVTPQRAETKTRLLDLRPVLRNRPVMGYVLGYGFHAWELLSLRYWLVPYLAFSLTLRENGGAWLAPTAVAALGALVATVASIIGGELATRFGRLRVISLVMATSAAMACAIGFAAPLPYAALVPLVLLYNALVQADSAALTTGAVQLAEPGRRGATLAVHSMVGFTGGALGPVVVGVVLDLAGGGGTVWSWGMAFASTGLVAALGLVALAVLGRKRS